MVDSAIDGASSNAETPARNNGRTFVGIGFGPIQAGLFAYEAFISGNFSRLVVAEIQPELVAALRAARGRYALNIAHATHVENVPVAPVELYDANVASERAQLIEAIAEASEIATAVSSVSDFATDLDGSVDKVLAAGLLRKLATGGARAVIYTGENNNHAAELLHEAIGKQLPAEKRAQALAQVRILNTVIGKMSGIAPATPGIAPVVADFPRAFLVEAYNYILISRIDFDADAEAPFQRGITRFIEKPDLLPFEEAKLYCINALHAFAAYLGKLAGCTSMAQLVKVPGLLPLVREGVVHEPGAALVRKYAAFDAFFTADSMAHYIDDYIQRMVNPALDDSIDRVCRDPRRKLGWDDRLVGAMRLALAHGITPHRFALGTAAALQDLVPEAGAYPQGVLAALWARPPEDAETVRTLDALVAAAWQDLAAFVNAGSDTPQAPPDEETSKPATAQAGSEEHAAPAPAPPVQESATSGATAVVRAPSTPEARSSQPLIYSSTTTDTGEAA